MRSSLYNCTSCWGSSRCLCFLLWSFCWLWCLSWFGRLSRLRSISSLWWTLSWYMYMYVVLHWRDVTCVVITKHIHTALLPLAGCWYGYQKGPRQIQATQYTDENQSSGIAYSPWLTQTIPCGADPALLFCDFHWCLCIMPCLLYILLRHMTQHSFIAQSHVSTWNILQLYNVYMYAMCMFINLHPTF